MHKVVRRNVPEYLVELLPNIVNAITSTVEQVDSDQCDLLSEKLRKSL